MEKTVPKYKLVAWSLLAVFWVFGTYSFPIQEIVPALFEPVFSAFNLLGDVTLILLGFWTLRSRMDIALYIALLVIGITSALINDTPRLLVINGMRPYLISISLLIIVRYLLSTRERVRYFLPLFEKSLYIFLLLQMPVMVIQCIRWGAYDNVGGTLGWMFSGPISTLIYLISFYLMVRRWDYSLSYIDNLRRNIILVIALFPSLLNETKISFIYMVMYFFFLIPMDRMFFKRMLYVAPLMLLAVGGFAAVYLTLLNDTKIEDYDGIRSDVTSTKFLSDYIVGDDGMRTLVLDGYLEAVMPEVEEEDFARGLKYSALPIIISDTPHAWYVGFGPSQFKGGKNLQLTKFAQEYDWLLRGTQMSFMSYLIDLGMAGVLWLVWYLLVLFRAFRHVRKRDKRVTWFTSISMIMCLSYIALHALIIPMIVFTFVAMISSRVPLFKYAPLPSGWLLKPLPKGNGASQSSHALGLNV